jgi:hypothetical protein
MVYLPNDPEGEDQKLSTVMGQQMKFHRVLDDCLGLPLYPKIMNYLI